MLASRLSSCIRKSRRRPTGSPLLSAWRISTRWLSSLSSSSSTSSFWASKASSTSSRAGSASTSMRSIRSRCLARAASSTSGMRLRTVTAMAAMSAQRVSSMSPIRAPSLARMVVMASSVAPSKAPASAISGSASTSGSAITPGQRKTSTGFSGPVSGISFEISVTRSRIKRTRSMSSCISDFWSDERRMCNEHSTFPRFSTALTCCLKACSFGRSSSGSRNCTSR